MGYGGTRIEVHSDHEQKAWALIIPLATGICFKEFPVKVFGASNLFILRALSVRIRNLPPT